MRQLQGFKLHASFGSVIFQIASNTASRKHYWWTSLRHENHLNNQYSVPVFCWYVLALDMPIWLKYLHTVPVAVSASVVPFSQPYGSIHIHIVFSKRETWCRVLRKHLVKCQISKQGWSRSLDGAFGIYAVRIWTGIWSCPLLLCVERYEALKDLTSCSLILYSGKWSIGTSPTCILG